ncbi:MAG: hypothetical protein M1813_004599 [Trichoglossum hirsutum]|jgi:hypothetical protein|nr:MAG: hypothetical protein M1813_004599 [Trichoglossum hirsutum]
MSNHDVARACLSESWSKTASPALSDSNRENLGDERGAKTAVVVGRDLVREAEDFRDSPLIQFYLSVGTRGTLPDFPGGLGGLISRGEPYFHEYTEGGARPPLTGRPPSTELSRAGKAASFSGRLPPYITYKLRVAGWASNHSQLAFDAESHGWVLEAPMHAR